MPTEQDLPKRALGIDFGLARIGLALSDERNVIATPLDTIAATRQMEKTTQALIDKIQELENSYRCQINPIIVGLPLHMNGKVGFLADEVQHLVSLLKEKLSQEVLTWDERLTSVQADRSLRETKMSRKKRAKVIDRVSAAIILQGYLDYCSLKEDLPPIPEVSE